MTTTGKSFAVKTTEHSVTGEKIRSQTTYFAEARRFLEKEISLNSAVN
jgi:hypothetical protein